MPLDPGSLNESAKRMGRMLERLLFVDATTRSRGNLRRLDLEVRDELIRGAEIVALARRVLQT
jgi:hypothetical protein